MNRETEAGEEYIKLRKCYLKLLTSMDMQSNLVSALFAEGVIDENGMEKINSKLTRKEQAYELLLIILNKCRSGERPYQTFLSALEYCGQEYLSQAVREQRVKEKHWDMYSSSFLNRRMTITTTTDSVENTPTKQTERWVQDCLDCNNNQQINNPPNTGNQNFNESINPNMKQINNIIPDGVGGQFQQQNNVGAAMTGVGHGHSFSPQQRYTQPTTKTLDQENRAAMVSRNHKRLAYQPSYTKSPHLKPFRIQNKGPNPSDPNGQNKFIWSSNPKLQNERLSADYEVFFENIYEELPGEEMNQTIRNFCGPGHANPDRKCKRRRTSTVKSRRDSRMTVDSCETVGEVQMTIYDEATEAVREPGAASVIVVGFPQNVNDISHFKDQGPNLDTNGSFDSDSLNRTNICSSCQQIYSESNEAIGFANNSVFPVRTDSNLSVDVLNASSDQIINNRPKRKKKKSDCCCIIL